MVHFRLKRGLGGFFPLQAILAVDRLRETRQNQGFAYANPVLAKLADTV